MKKLQFKVHLSSVQSGHNIHDSTIHIRQGISILKHKAQMKT